MEQTLQQPATYDFRKYDQIWRRVSPNLEPYPDLQDMAVPAMASLAPGPSSPQAGPAPAAAEGLLPGAEQNPCCMGTSAREMMEVIEGFIEIACADQRYYLAIARQAPSSARARLRALAESSAAAARRLMAVRYLISGECYRPAVVRERISVGNWCSVLRERYHVEACNAMNYLRAAEETTDPCLGRLLTELGEESYHHADVLMAMLERAL